VGVAAAAGAFLLGGMVVADGKCQREQPQHNACHIT
jgi:hypothetical protein